ncbi:MAG: DUF11 domain-containing protein [Myxococcales bacterium]|nr:DUF11 domain-containing protein [Myxococcales bacterium]MCB9525230.1 DUF11 domain-containing protein [Myxococcales bacterium]
MRASVMRWSRLLALALWAAPSLGLAVGDPLGPDPDRVFEGNLDYAVTAATQLICQDGSCAGSGHQCQGQPAATAVLDVIPESPTLVVEYAQLNWFASLPQGQAPDLEVTFTPPGGAATPVQADPVLSEAFDDGLAGQECQIVQLICPALQSCALTFHSSYADVTDVLEAHRQAGGTLNGLYRLADATVPGSSSDDPGTAIASVGSLTIGGWSLFVVYRDEANLGLRRIYFYKGLELNEGEDRMITARGFRAPPDAAVDLSYLVLEGDEGISGDGIAFNGQRLSDGCNPQNNSFNSTVNSGRADGQCQRGVNGVDLDTFHVEGALEAGDTEANVTFIIPRGDGLFTAGEQLFTNWLVLAFDHIPPDFSDVKPQKRAAPPGGSEVYPGDRIDYLIEVRNNGGDFADDVVLTDGIPEGTDYVAGSSAVDRRPIVDAFGGGSPWVDGFNLTELPEIETIGPGESHTIQFSVTVREDAPDTIVNVAYIEAPGAPRAETLPVTHLVVRGPRPDGGAEPDLGPPEDMGEAPPADLGAAPEAGTPDANFASDAGGCPAGTTLVGERCESLCGEGLIFVRECGACRPAEDPTCEGGGANSGCGCDVQGGEPAPAWLLLGLLLGLRRRRR